MYRCISNITVTQRPSLTFPNRRTVLGFDFVTSFESSDSWRDLTNKGKLTLPKNLYFRDGNGKLQPLQGTNINVGGFSSQAPLFLRGDAVLIDSGYKYFNKEGREITDMSRFFTGFISKVGSRVPIDCELEDYMWLLKQTPIDTRTYSDSDTLEKIMQDIIAKVNSMWGTSLTTKALTETTFGGIVAGNESAAELLKRMQRLFGFEFYFRGTELRGGVIIYIEEEAIEHQFRFQQNIISDELEYQRRDDVVLSAIAHNTIVVSNGTTKDGKAKTKRERIEVLVTIKNGKRVDKVISRGERVPENIEGERRTFFFPGAKTATQLADLAYAKLIIYYYTGLKGSFTTFGIPFVRQGDNVNIKDPKLPERDGLYKVKSVKYSGGVRGLRQVIELDYRISDGSQGVTPGQVPQI